MEISLFFCSYSSASFELDACLSSSSFSIFFLWSSSSIPCSLNFSISFRIFKEKKMTLTLNYSGLYQMLLWIHYIWFFFQRIQSNHSQVYNEMKFYITLSSEITKPWILYILETMNFYETTKIGTTENRQDFVVCTHVLDWY